MRRTVTLVLVLLAIAVAVSVSAIAVLYQIVAREPTVPAKSTLVLRPGGRLPDVASADFVDRFFGGGEETVRDFVDSLRKARRDPRIGAVLLVPSAIATPYWGKLQELRDAVLDFRTSGKAVVAFLESGGDREYFLATAASQVYLLPTSTLDLTGVASYEIFLRGTLDKIGAVPDFLHVGDYKTATNQLTEKTFTPAHRDMSESLNKEAYDQLVRGIAAGRGKSEADVRAIINRGPFLARDALSLGLVDGLGYEDQLDDLVPELHEAPRGRDRIEGSDYHRVSERSAGLRPRSKVAVLYAAGAIASGPGGYDPINGPVVGSDSLVEEIRRIRGDDSVKAIVLRIDSPGGSSTASDVIWRELMITRDEKRSRPLIVSMSDLAASGGYYIATPGQVIVAQPGTLTGSIGIYAGKIVTGGTMHKLGVTTETVASGRNATMGSPVSTYSPSERAAMERMLKDFYGHFLERVAASRRMTPADVDRLGQGRVWTGQQAKDRGLVDVLGGLDTAVAIAKQRAGIPESEDVQLVRFTARRSLSQTLAGLSGQARGRWMSPRPIFRQPFRRGERLALMPLVAGAVDDALQHVVLH
jgi:protease-4